MILKFITFIKATFDLTFFFSILGLNLLPQALVTWETDLSVLMDFFFLSFSLSEIVSPMLPSRFDFPSYKVEMFITEIKAKQSSNIARIIKHQIPNHTS